MFLVGVLKGDDKRAPCLVLGRQKILEQTRTLVLCPLGDEPWSIASLLACVWKHRINIEKDLFLCKCNFSSVSPAQLEWQ